MFKKFTIKENCSGQSQIRSSVQRGIRQKIIDQYPVIEDTIDEILPKKTPIVVAKCHDHVSLICVNNEPLFFNQRDGPYFPTLRLLHKYPTIMPRFQVDKGAIKFVFSGANIMAPGLTSAGGDMDMSVDGEAPVGIFAEGKEHALAVGIATMSAEDIKKKNKGIAVETIHFLNDGLWKEKTLD